MKRINLFLLLFICCFMLTGCVIFDFGRVETVTPTGDNPTVEETETQIPEPALVYSVTYIINGHGVKPDDLSDVSVLPTLPILSENGYNFIGWYYDVELNNKANDGDLLDSNVTLYAKWEVVEENIKKYSISFNINGHGVKPDNIIDVTTIPTLPSLNESGWVFKGWYIDSDCTTAVEVGSKLRDDLTLYAKWEVLEDDDDEESFVVTFMNDSSVFDSINVSKNTKVTKPSANPSKTNYNFICWSTAQNSQVSFDFDTLITSDLTLYAYFELIDDNDSETINVTSYSGYDEGAYIEFDSNGYNSSDFNISYNLLNNSNEVSVDSELIRSNGNTIRCDIVGLVSGTYEINITNTKTNQQITKEIFASKSDRSGYAHFDNNGGVGAYNDDGSLKSNAIVIYVNDNNKNSVSVSFVGTTYTGLGSILANASKSSYPICVRILGSIKTAQWNYKNHGTGSSSSRQSNLESTFEDATFSNKKLYYSDIVSLGINSMSNDLNSGITILNGLTTAVLYDGEEYDSYYNMLDIQGASNITVEGIGCDALIYQWGFNFKKCNNIEVKNITFDSYTEDAVGFEGDKSNISTYGNYWLHNCTFNIGLNNWDVCYEADKGDGDGSSDFKYCRGVTISHCRYNSTHKTILIGGSNTAQQYNFTIQHNYFNSAGSRLPLVRQANIHIYNNYFYNVSSSCSSVRANAFAFVENNYYDSSKNPYIIVKDSKYTGTVVKSYGNYYTNCSVSDDTSTESYYKSDSASSRTQSFSGSCNPTGSKDLSNFDTNSSLFYYDSTNKVSNVDNLLDASSVKDYCMNYSGVLKGDFIQQETEEDNNDNSNEDNNDNENNEDVNGSVIYISFDDFITSSITSTTTINGVTINPQSGKSLSIEEKEQTLAGQTIQKYVKLGGGGSYSTLSITFEVLASANITVYYSNSSSSNRYCALFDSENNKTSATTDSNSSTGVVNYTFTNIEAGSYSVGSSNSGLNIHLIVIEYI